MGNAMMDQLLKAGVVDKKKANRAKQQRRDQQRQGQAQDASRERMQAIEQQQRAKAEHDRELNRQRQQAQQVKAQQEQIQQLIEAHKLKRDDADIPFHFSYGDRIPSILVSAQQRAQIATNKLRIVNAGDGFELVPCDVADKICQRDAALVVTADQREMDDDEARAYEAFPVPDDLIW